MERIVFNWARDIPVVTRCWAGGILLTSILISTGVIHLTDIVFVPSIVWKKGQYWRLITPFLYFGELDYNLLVSLFVITQHSRNLEESFSSALDYLWFVILNTSLLVGYGFYFGSLHQMLLGSQLLDSLLYVWGRTNPEVVMGFLGVLNFRACYYAFFTVAQVFLFRGEGSMQIHSFAGLIVGHLIFYFGEVFSKVHGVNILQPPWHWFTRREPEPVIPDAPPQQQQQ